MMLNKIVPEGLPYRHSCEGPDDMVRKKFRELIKISINFKFFLLFFFSIFSLLM